ncbi:Predicted dithiol-disulfide isomerase, DsbA family [Actinopolyspora mzabensis]|uniref:Predicted dithiol-disulfide isomerase, DsbA family n=1 Tax=Actinopolyspora mzabensis TaxID=995066 RepID=A0A1G8ZAL2_ACTMZ|nr:DsbA family oxidoreductase [Actinopolyspora mzabensis]SDK12057.1 Predicted dithiol-disulfide isomerase, DsbA family [Actinopolyspora mzabensis]
MSEKTERKTHAPHRIGIVLDIACVWSYLGYTRFSRVAARRRNAGYSLEVTFHPFQVAPEASPQGEWLTTAHQRDFGSEAEQKEQQLTRFAAAEGIPIHFDRAVFTNTFEAHRLIAVAAEQGMGEAITERLFRAYFVEGHNVADRDTLSSLAAESGVAWSEEGAARLRDELARTRENTNAVPRFIVEGGKTLTGLQSEESLDAALEAAEDEHSNQS